MPRRVHLVVAAAGLLAACAGSVSVPPPTGVDDATSRACATVAEALPETVDGAERRETDPDSPLTAAWGDPTIVLRCGVPAPGVDSPTDQLVVVEGVEWLPQELSAGYRFTTWDRAVTVEVTVPEAYAPEVNALVDLAPALAEASGG